MTEDNTKCQVELHFLKSKIGRKQDFYNKLSQLYWLPAINSKALTNHYLKQYIYVPCPVFRLERKNYCPPHIPHKHVNSQYILETIEVLLAQKKYPPTGFDEDHLPDLDWLIAVYFFLSPNDEKNLFPKSIKPEKSVLVDIDPKYFSSSFFLLFNNTLGLHLY